MNEWMNESEKNNTKACVSETWQEESIQIL
jgi:hypothetical protein